MTLIIVLMKINENYFYIRMKQKIERQKKRFTWFTDSGAAEDDHLDPVYVCHQLRGLSVIRTDLASHIASAANAPITSLCTLPPYSYSRPSAGHWHSLARTKRADVLSRAHATLANTLTKLIIITNSQSSARVIIAQFRSGIIINR